MSTELIERLRMMKNAAASDAADLIERLEKELASHLQHARLSYETHLAVENHLGERVNDLERRLSMTASTAEPVAWRKYNGQYYALQTDMKSMRKDFISNGWEPLYASSQITASVVPEGWKLVPIEPTLEMSRSGTLFGASIVRTDEIYRAMIAAAPSPARELEGREK